MINSTGVVPICEIKDPQREWAHVYSSIPKVDRNEHIGTLRTY